MPLTEERILPLATTLAKQSLLNASRHESPHEQTAASHALQTLAEYFGAENVLQLITATPLSNQQ